MSDARIDEAIRYAVILRGLGDEKKARVKFCPECKTPGAYVGLHAIECPSTRCRHYSPKAPGCKLYDASGHVAGPSPAAQPAGSPAAPDRTALRKAIEEGLLNTNRADAFRDQPGHFDGQRGYRVGRPPLREPKEPAIGVVGAMNVRIVAGCIETIGSGSFYRSVRLLGVECRPRAGVSLLDLSVGSDALLSFDGTPVAAAFGVLWFAAPLTAQPGLRAHARIRNDWPISRDVHLLLLGQVSVLY